MIEDREGGVVYLTYTEEGGGVVFLPTGNGPKVGKGKYFSTIVKIYSFYESFSSLLGL